MTALETAAGHYSTGVTTEADYKAFDEELARIHLDMSLEDLDYGEMELEYEPSNSAAY